MVIRNGYLKWLLFHYHSPILPITTILTQSLRDDDEEVRLLQMEYGLTDQETILSPSALDRKKRDRRHAMKGPKGEEKKDTCVDDVKVDDNFDEWSDVDDFGEKL